MDSTEKRLAAAEDELSQIRTLCAAAGDESAIEAVIRRLSSSDDFECSALHDEYMSRIRASKKFGDDLGPFPHWKMDALSAAAAGRNLNTDEWK